MAPITKPDLYAPGYQPKDPAAETAIDFLFDRGVDPEIREAAEDKAARAEKARAEKPALVKSLGSAPRIQGPNASTTEVICGKCSRTMVPQLRWAGNSVGTTVIAAGVPLLTGIVLMLLSRPQPIIDTVQRKLIDTQPLVIPAWAWAACLLLSLLPAVVYGVWRAFKSRWVCHACGSPEVWAVESDVGRMLEARRLRSAPAQHPLA